MPKKKILLLSDDMRTTSGVATMSRELVLNTVKEYDWVQLGALVQHPENGKLIDLSEDAAKQTGVADASVKLYASTGYGSQDVLRQLIMIERPDAILHFTDPRFWGWLYQMEHEIRQTTPLMFYTIWDANPAPLYNGAFYESCDLLMSISKQTNALVKKVLKSRSTKYEDWQTTYVPHGINHTRYFPITEDMEIYKDYAEFKNSVIPKETEFVLFYNARNIRRKHTSDAILAYKEFCDKLDPKKAEKCLFLLHCDPIDDNGTDLPAVIKTLCPNYPIKFTETRVLPVDKLNYLYNMADVTINIASNEGFGLGTAESVMAGTPIIVNVTGGLQDQCGFMKDDGTFLTEKDYNDSFETNADKVYTKHGIWSKPVFPAVRTLQGSPATPYIYDDICDYHDAADAIRYWYDIPSEKRKEYGLKGREHFMKPETGLCAQEMGNRMINDINTMFNNWKPRTRVETIKL